MLQRVRSADGARIAFDRTGDGPAVIFVEAAGRYRAFSSFDGIARVLARDFAVYRYDRRGRGESTDGAEYAPEREVEDLAALIEHAGGRAHVYGYSSGALLAMHAAAAGLGIDRLALMEPPLQDDPGEEKPNPLTVELEELVAAGRHGDAVECFSRGIGVPDELVAQMRSTPAWAHMKAVAPTLVYDCKLSDATGPAVIGAVEVPTLVLDSLGSGDELSGWAAAVATRLPNATHRSLAGEWHTVPDEVLAPALAEFFRG